MGRDMREPDPKKIARIASLNKQAGEVRFIKDRSGDAKEWAWAAPGASDRKISDNFLFNAKQLKPLALTLRSALMALGHVTSAHARFVKIKSRNISPDGALGGMGYVQKIPDMRRQLMNCIEVLSATTDTLFDEIQAPHWQPAGDVMTSRDREDVQQIVEQAEDIKDDPENWALEEELEEEAEQDLETPAPDAMPLTKQASSACSKNRRFVQSLTDGLSDVILGMEFHDEVTYAEMVLLLSGMARQVLDLQAAQAHRLQGVSRER